MAGVVGKSIFVAFPVIIIVAPIVKKTVHKIIKDGK
jgi:hypothetical protein